MSEADEVDARLAQARFIVIRSALGWGLRGAFAGFGIATIVAAVAWLTPFGQRLSPGTWIAIAASSVLVLTILGARRGARIGNSLALYMLLRTTMSELGSALDAEAARDETKRADVAKARARLEAEMERLPQALRDDLRAHFATKSTPGEKTTP